MSKPEPRTAEWLSAREVAARLKISRSAAFALMRKLPRLKVGRITRVTEDALNAFLLTNMQPPRPAPNTSLETQLRAANALLRSYEAGERASGRSTPKLSSSPPAPRRIRHTRQPVILPFPETPQLDRSRGKRS